MGRQQVFEQLAEDFDLKPADYYFLELIPLIEVMWLDGKNQQSELNILYQFVVEHIAYIDQAAGIQVLTVKDANDFLDRFAHQKPPQKLLTGLHNIIAKGNGVIAPRKMNILEYCLDISAACVVHYPYGMRERIRHDEKEFLLRLFAEFNISPKKPADIF
ncbi:hypothetical protein BJAS_P0774 [Bathymodiolus japonicus methanotrophic gill symbiont]|uniref:hypothetical protein n=1 Tax=Bathymodiolus japonicus methanotrophic gill symbiont TaxID=113269 RepID=UPI001B522D6F|nr:hypothetical protein [Bathymodiolus japonicus methanotrophic gill symbiont]GFO71361.1 hypothetical protein BJAS_P0774 [Bathymodiolus japonicus methanotrophic gill symbiont]